MANVILGQLRDFWKGVYDWVKGVDEVSKPKVFAELSGSKMELYGATISDRPAANAVPVGATFTIVDENLDQNWISNGTDWVEV
jgi:hypothetical protein